MLTEIEIGNLKKSTFIWLRSKTIFDISSKWSVTGGGRYESVDCIPTKKYISYVLYLAYIPCFSIWRFKANVIGLFGHISGHFISILHK